MIHTYKWYLVHDDFDFDTIHAGPFDRAIEATIFNERFLNEQYKVVFREVQLDKPVD